MTQPTLIATVQKFEIDNVGGVSLTDIAQDANSNYVRELRIIGVVDADNSSAPLVFTLRLSSSVQANVTLSTPALSF